MPSASNSKKRYGTSDFRQSPELPAASRAFPGAAGMLHWEREATGMMRISNKGIGLELTESLQTYIAEKIGGLEHFLGAADGAVDALVEVGRSTHHHRKGDVFFARVNIHIGGKTLRSEASSGDPRAAIDLVRDELHDEILKFKGKHETLFRRGARSLKKLLRLSPLARFRRLKEPPSGEET